MHGVAYTARVGVRIHSRGRGDAVRCIRGEGTGAGGARASSALVRVLSPARRRGVPFRRQNA